MKITFQFLTTLLLMSLLGAAAAPGNLINTAPSSAAGGTQVTVSGTSSSPGNTAVDVSDDLGSIPHTVTWDGNRFTIVFTMPDVAPPNTVTVLVKDGNCTDSADIKTT